MPGRYDILITSYAVLLILTGFLRPVSALSCYECVSTFPGSNVCLPSCAQTTKPNSTCLLTRDIALEPSTVGSLRAGHISNEPIIANAVEKSFLFGEEAVYQNPSPTVGWDWEYGPITYGCDTPGCNNPENINRLPNALNARIPNETLNRLLTGDLDSSCYVCNLCLDDDVTMTDMSDCGYTACPQHSCSFVATRSATTGPVQCDGGWHFTSGCILSREPAQVQMTVMHYILSKTTVLYQMEAVCLSDNCNNLTTFRQLKAAITVDPDLTCLGNGSSSSTTSSSTSSTTRPTGTESTTTSSGPTSSTTTGTGSSTATSGSTSRTTSGPGTAPPTTTSSAVQMFMNMKLLILILASFYTIKF